MSEGTSTKNVNHAQRILVIKGVKRRGGGCLRECIKKRKFEAKIFFSLLLNEVLKVLEK